MTDLQRLAQNMGLKIHPAIWDSLYSQFGPNITITHVVLFLLEDKSRDMERSARRLS